MLFCAVDGKKVCAQTDSMSFKYKLPPGYSIQEIPTEEFSALWLKPSRKIFKETLFYDSSLVNSKKELAQFKKLREEFGVPKHYRLNLALYYKNKLVGWSWGYQETSTIFYMCNSAVFPKHRQKGLYTCLMREMLTQVAARGFAKVYSRHVMTNNDVIIAKLKQGFKITHFELSEAFGTLVHLTYFPSKIKNEILDFRSGLKRPGKKMKKIFKL